MDQPEEAPPWEQVRPSEWLRMPYFRNGDPDKVANGDHDWVAKVKEVVRDGLRDGKREEIDLTKPQINDLALILARYIKAHEDWRGWLSKEDRTRLQNVQTKASELSLAIAKLKETSGASDRSSDWYLDAMLRKRDDCASLDQLVALLSFLSNFEIRSPAFVGEDTINHPFLSPAREEVRAQLQGDIDEWWSRVTNLSKAKQEEAAPAYHRFLAETLGRFRMYSAGTSDKAIAEARKSFKSKKEKSKARFLASGAMLNSIKG